MSKQAKIFRYISEAGKPINISGEDFILPYFKAKELACPTTGIVSLEEFFVDHLFLLRHMYSKAMNPTSCCRSLFHNTKIGGHKRSLHLIVNTHWKCTTIALDVSETDQELRDLAWSLGWSIGYGDTFTHLDRRVDIGLPQTEFYYS